MRVLARAAKQSGDAPIGSSKRGGLPDLPPDVDWPMVDGHKTALLLQVSFSELAAADRSGWVPPEGLLSVFANATGHGRVIVTPACTPLERKPCPEPPKYLEVLVATEDRLAFVPGFYFRVASDTGAPGAVARALPASLIERIGALTGCRPSDAFGGDRLFGGDPVDWQAMGESYVKGDLFAQLGFADGHLSVGIDHRDLVSRFFDEIDVGYCGT